MIPLFLLSLAALASYTVACVLQRLTRHQKIAHLASLFFVLLSLFSLLGIVLHFKMK